VPKTIIGVRELKIRLSQYLQCMKSGESFVITEQHSSGGQIVPAKRDIHSQIQYMVTAGLCTWNGEQYLPGEPVVANCGTATLSDLVVKEREKW
jgi:antitoxin (DNA-binding transcriptional repressor) of toxin-antitoxin stability system